MDNSFKLLYDADISRYGQSCPKRMKHFHYYHRKAQTANCKLLKLYYRFIFSKIKDKYGIEMSYRSKIGQGFYIGHPYNITINQNAVLGSNVNIHKGATVGQENRGHRQGVPIIGNNVWIGINAVIVGRVHIGDDVLIAPNSYVNCDVPAHSIVFGNPCQIKHCDNATLGYINNPQ